ncbi:MAG: protein rep [Tolypothrix carrinoi HA7290-LM1]|nr:protein rep [Tolypothrix carrinoi HA7290-LM1]
MRIADTLEGCGYTNEAHLRGLNSSAVVHISAIALHHDPKLLIPEILKYQLKESDLVADREWFLELTRQLHKTRAIAVGGILRHYMRELEEKNQDLVGESEEMNEVDRGSLLFRWGSKQKKYY